MPTDISELDLLIMIFEIADRLNQSCNGLGNVYNIDIKLLIPDNSVSE